MDGLRAEGISQISIYDPIVKDETVFGLKNQKPNGKFDLVIYAVNHKDFKDLDTSSLLNPHGSVIDIPRKLDKKKLESKGIRYWGP